MDIYIVRKCKVEVKEFPGTNGARYKVPVMTQDDVYSYVVKAQLNSLQRDKLQKELEHFYTEGDTDEKSC